ncbi:MAG: VOC family protein [Leucobacter sp.]
MSLSIAATMHTFALDCPDARPLAEFYATLLGWEVDVNEEEPDWVNVLPPEGTSTNFRIAFQQVETYIPPTWPDGPIPQQAHLDFRVPSIVEATPTVLAAGATLHSAQPGEADGWLVFLDPAGHPFCLTE